MNDLATRWLHPISVAICVGLLAVSDFAVAYSDHQLSCYQRISNAEYQDAVKPCRIAAMDGDAEAQFKLASLYANGDGVQKDLSGSVAWLEKAAAQGHLEASYILAIVLENDFTRDRNLLRAADIYRSAAESGHLKSQRKLAMMYESGSGVSQDLQQAFRWHLKSAEGGLVQGQLRVGVMLLVGKGTPANRSESIFYLHKAASNGEPDAQLFLARELLAEQPLVAVDWFERAINQGHVQAMHQYAKYLSSSIDKADLRRAADLADLAVKAGSETSVALFAAINEKIANASTTTNASIAKGSSSTHFTDQRFTIQLISLSSLARAENFIRQHELEYAHIEPITREEQTIYVVSLGDYSDRATALNGLQALPTAIKKLEPLVKIKNF